MSKTHYSILSVILLLVLIACHSLWTAQNPLAFKNTIRDCGTQIAANLTYEERLQLLVFLVEIAKSDGDRRAHV